MRRVCFNDVFGQTVNLISGRMTMFAKPLSEDGCKKLAYYCRTQDLLDENGFFKKLPAKFEKFISRYSYWKIGDVMAIQQSYKDVWKEIRSEEYFNIHRGELGWNNKFLVKADAMLYNIKVVRFMLLRQDNLTDEQCQSLGVVASNDPYSGEILGWFHEGLGAKLFPTPLEAYKAAFEREHGDRWGENPWMWLYELEIIKREVKDGEMV